MSKADSGLPASPLSSTRQVTRVKRLQEWNKGEHSPARKPGTAAKGTTLMRPPPVKRQTSPESGFFLFSAFRVPAQSAIALVF
jgi:hypothetical protein